MNYKAYGTRKTVPQRMTRKRARRDVFLANSRMAKAARKARRLKQKSQEQSDE